VSAAIAQKPSDIIKFGASWFASLREGQKGKGGSRLLGEWRVCLCVYACACGAESQRRWE